VAGLRRFRERLAVEVVDRLADDARLRHKYDDSMPNDKDARNAERKLRAAARAGHMTVEVVALGERKPSPYASCTPEERLAAAVRLIEHHQALRGGFSKLPRSAWPGEVVVAGEAVG
jgi:hypothetical protein